MPCQCGSPNPEVEKKQWAAIRETKRLLCEVMQRLELEDNGDALEDVLSNVKGLLPWWNDHKLADKQRLDRLTENVRAKLGNDGLEAILEAALKK